MQNWMNRHRVFSRLVLLSATWMIWEAFRFGAWFATGNARNGMEIAAIIAAVTAPVTAYGGWVFQIYANNRTKDDDK